MVRKASLQLSINAIVILIMAIAMLGVGIFFINETLRGELGTLGGLSADVKEQIKSSLQQSGERVFLSGVNEGEFVMGQNQEKSLSVVILNELESDEEFTVAIKQNTADRDTGDYLGTWEPFYQSGANTIAVGDIADVLVTFKSGSQRGRVIYTIDVMQGAETYSSQSFHLVVR
jgi:hypothetical protein